MIKISNVKLLKPIKVENDIKMNIAVGDSRHSKTWKNIEVSWSELLVKLADTKRTGETIKEYFAMSRAKQSEIKDVGGFVGGTLKSGRRKAENLANRSMLTLDMDFVNTSVDDVWDAVTMFFGSELCIYTTHSHKPDKPRIRLVIPLNRPVLPDEYQAIARRVANDVGIDMFDDTTYTPIRLMYWPSTASDGEYVFRHQTGGLLDADEILASYFDWTDIKEWPTSSREDNIILSKAKRQEDPYEKKGLIGAFCRTYSIQEVIEIYLPDIYSSTGHEDRYTYLDGSTVGGLVVYDDKFAYSHHGTDPISEQLCNAFDLVRIHKFGSLDDSEEVKEGTPINRMPSFTKMVELAQDDDKVKSTLGMERLESVEGEFEFGEDEEEDLSWLKSLTYDKKGLIENTIQNALIVLENDPRLKNKLVYDEFANRALVKNGVPWTDMLEHDWIDMDDSGVRFYLERKYGITTAYKIEDAKNLVFDRNKYHPVREYLTSLEWDGVKRIESLFIDYLGAVDNIYTRNVAKIQMVGAVARVMRPGVKFDTMPTFSGPQGIGKSTFISKLAKGWCSDSLDTMKGKEAAELIQGVWHVEVAELNATRKADRDMVKSFLSRQEDIYRVAYAKHTTRFPRQCVFWGTTNDSDFLRDPTGDRRTYPILCHEQLPTKNIWDDLDNEVDQLWAEAYQMFKDGESLHLTGEVYEMAAEVQKEFKEDTPLAGLIEEYLNRDYPAGWPDMDLAERLSYIRGDGDTFTYGDINYIKDRVCVMEIWQELLNKRPGDLKPINSREINDILRGLEGWEPIKSQLSFGKMYGQQRGFIRKG